MNHLWERLAAAVNALPLIRRKLKEPLTGSDLCQILHCWKQVQKESIEHDAKS
jgi:hypothetical protein